MRAKARYGFATRRVGGVDLGELGLNEYGSGAGGAGEAGVLPVGDEGDLAGARLLNTGHAGDLAGAVAPQLRSQLPGKLR